MFILTIEVSSSMDADVFSNELACTVTDSDSCSESEDTWLEAVETCSLASASDALTFLNAFTKLIEKK
jgi:hypothetical protein